MNVLDKIVLYLSAILCGHCQKELLKSQKITLRVNTNKYIETLTLSAIIRYNPLQDRSTEREAMRKQLVLIIPILAAMISMIAMVGQNAVNAQNMSTPETNMTTGTNATMGGNMTSGNISYLGPTNMTTP